MVAIIIKNKPYRLGKHRSEQEKELRREGMKTMTEEQLDKCRFLEKKAGFWRSFFDKSEIDKVR